MPVLSQEYDSCFLGLSLAISKGVPTVYNILCLRVRGVTSTSMQSSHGPQVTDCHVRFVVS